MSHRDAQPMKERAIIFSGPMVRAILDGRKTQTRRLIGLNQLQPSETPGYDWTFRGRAPVRSIAQQQRHPSGCWQDLTTARLLALCPYGKPGDRLWARETWGLASHTYPTEWRRGSIADASAKRIAEWWRVEYRADREGGHGSCHWRPAIHMPSWASRATLLITDVRVQRLHEISDEDATAEGVTRGVVPPDEDGPARVGYTLGDDDGRCALHPTPRDAFAAGWDSINGERGPWASNPWAWVIGFERVVP